jgi:hypothetical protein
MKPRRRAAFGLVGIVLWAAAVCAADVQPAPRIDIDQREYTFAPVVDGETVVHDFVVRNQGQTDLEIYKVRTG